MPVNQSDHIGCIIQARMTSSRLPGKVMQEICGEPMLHWVLTRARQSRRIHQVMVATTVNAADDSIVDFCEQNGYHYYRGSEFDVLDRYYQAAKSIKADIVVRLTADCPLIDPRLMDETIDNLFRKGADFSANRLPPPFKRTYPIGLDVEVVTFRALECAWRNATEKHEREHVLPYIYAPEHGFQVTILNALQDYGELRWTVDTAEDLAFVRAVMDYLSCRPDFSWLDVLKIVSEHPELSQINADIPHKSYRDVDARNHQVEG